MRFFNFDFDLIHLRGRVFFRVIHIPEILVGNRFILDPCVLIDYLTIL